MEFLLNPNIAYLLIVGAVLLTLIAIIVPGTGAPESVLLICLVAIVYITSQIGINLWPAVLSVLSIVPFFFALRAKKWRKPLLAATIVLLIGGSIFLFTDERSLPVIDPLLAFIVSVASGIVIWFGADHAALAMQRATVHDVDALIGQIGEARTAIHAEGSVQVNGELWSARSENPIKARSVVRILRREGLILTVEEKSE